MSLAINLSNGFKPLSREAFNFHSWEDYLSSLKSAYRRRIKLLTASFETIRKRPIPCSQFDDKMYGQYIEVLRRSKGKLETLSFGFFQNLPPEFELTAFYHAEVLTGWMITVSFRKKLYFFLGGIDYTLNRQYHTYFNILAEIIKEGIEMKASVIDLGQTAEIPKIRLGGKPVEKSMLGYHSNPLIRQFLKMGRRLLEYPVKVNENHVFKEIL